MVGAVGRQPADRAGVAEARMRTCGGGWTGCRSSAGVLVVDIEGMTSFIIRDEGPHLDGLVKPHVRLTRQLRKRVELV